MSELEPIYAPHGLADIDPELHGNAERMLGNLDFVDATNRNNLQEAEVLYRQVSQAADQAHAEAMEAAEAARQAAVRAHEVALQTAETATAAASNYDQSEGAYQAVDEYTSELRQRLQTDKQTIVDTTRTREAQLEYRETVEHDLTGAHEDLVKVEAELDDIGAKLNANDLATQQKQAEVDTNDQKFKELDNMINRFDPNTVNSAQAMAENLTEWKTSFEAELRELRGEEIKLSVQNTDATRRRSTIKARIDQLTTRLSEVDNVINQLDATITEARADFEDVRIAVDGISIPSATEQEQSEIAHEAITDTPHVVVESVELTSPANLGNFPLATQFMSGKVSEQRPDEIKVRDMQVETV